VRINLEGATIIEHRPDCPVAGKIDTASLAAVIGMSWRHLEDGTWRDTVFTTDSWRFERQGDVIFFHRTEPNDVSRGFDQPDLTTDLYTIVLPNTREVSPGW